MLTAPEQFVDLNKSNIDASLQLAKASFEAVERFVTFNMNAGRETLADAAKQARALTDVKDVHEYLAWRNKVAEANADKFMGYSKDLYDIAQQTQSQFTSLFEERLADVNKGVATALDKALKSAPAGADVVVAAIKSTVAATNSAIDSVTKAAKQAASFADSTVKATAHATAAASKATAK